MGFRRLQIALLERGLAALDRLARNRGADLPVHLQVGLSGEEQNHRR